ncbi:Premnaspirodiene oxygenase [Actinidia chinensis var. chinensis]|uniref:Premnaspirodiene oxygenase n=1 Tax=Actinidia chinensis var. chinensis TaxID=1590841 RepID=A0A2R6PT71_ACTCC|nr:Premnaspirodiene oxygenase [Actinidia chinensis var. chinensis]
MDFQFPSIPLLLACLLFLSMVVKIVKKSTSSSSIPKLPPGPWKLPIIGNIHQLVGSLPHHNLRKLAGTYGPLMHLQLGQVSTMVVSSPEIAKEVLKDHDIVFAQRPFLLASQIFSYGSTNIVFSPYGDYWRQMRKICVMELLSARRVQSFQGIREEEVLNLVKSISKDTGLSINLSKKISSLTYGMVARAAFGKRNKDQEEFISLVEEATFLAAGFSIVDLYPSVKVLEVITGMRSRLEKLRNRLDKILESIVNEHRDGNSSTEGGKSRETEDLVDVLLRVQKHGDLEFALTDDNIKAVILLPNGMKQEELDMEEAFGVTVRRKNDLILIPSRYHDSPPYGN